MKQTRYFPSFAYAGKRVGVWALLAGSATCLPSGTANLSWRHHNFATRTVQVQQIPLLLIPFPRRQRGSSLTYERSHRFPLLSQK